MFKSVISDFLEGWNRRELWLYTSLMDLKQRYKRSVLGPFWISISLALMIGSIGLLWSKLWQIPIKDYLPYFTVGLLIWTFISTLLTEATQLFVKSAGIIKQINLPFSYYVLALVWKNFVMFSHHLIVYFLVVIFFKVSLSWSFFLLLPGLMLYFINAFWITSCLSIICTRFRDIEQIVPSILTILFFMTPIIWKMGWSGKRAIFVYSNPLYHFIEILRAPMLGYTPTISNYLVVLLVTIIGTFLSFIMVGKYRKKVNYWL